MCMEPVPSVLDVSSDEEEQEQEQEEQRLEEKVDTTSTDYDWIKGIKGFLEMRGEEQHEVAVLTKKVKGVVGDEEGDDDDDDDCVILEGDPEKLLATSVSDSPPTGSDSDELFVVGEKGQIACRDYPHPRHLCANFPYSSTPHQRHCSQCHCYICDSPAPCPKWGTGLSSTDHCHATDKSEMWKTLRQTFKLGSKTASLEASTNCGTFGDAVNSQHNHTMNPLDVMKLSPNFMFMNQPSWPPSIHTYSLENLIPQNQASKPVIMNPSLVSRPNTIPVCSIASNFTTLHGANNGRFQESVSNLVRNKYQAHFDPRQLLGVSYHDIQRKRGLGARSLRPLSSHMMSNVVGSLGLGNTFTMNHSTHGASSFTNHGRYDAATGFSNSRTCYGHNDVKVPKYLLYPQPSSELAYEPQAYYQLNDSQSFYGNCIQGNATPPSSFMAHLNRDQHLYEPQIDASSFTNHGRYDAATGFSNSRTCYGHNDVRVPKNLLYPQLRSELAYEPQAYYQSNDSQSFYGNCIHGNAPSPSSYMAHLNIDQHLYEPKIGTQSEHSLGNLLEYGATMQDAYQRPHYESQSEYARVADFAGFDSSWVENTSDSISCLQSSGTTNIPIPPYVEESSTQVTKSPNLPVDDSNTGL